MPAHTNTTTSHPEPVGAHGLQPGVGGGLAGLLPAGHVQVDDGVVDSASLVSRTVARRR